MGGPDQSVADGTSHCRDACSVKSSSDKAMPICSRSLAAARRAHSLPIIIQHAAAAAAAGIASDNRCSCSRLITIARRSTL